MLKIGDFSKLSMVSVRMLRFYDENGLLAPVKVDKFTGYRYYSVKQLGEISRIRLLQKMGVSLNEIKTLKDCGFSKKEMLDVLHKAHEAKKQEQLEISAAILTIEKAIEKLERNEFMSNYNVELKTIPARSVVSVRRTLKAYSDEGILWEELRFNADKYNIKIAEPCYPMTMYMDKEYKDENPDVKVGLTVDGDYTDIGILKFSTTEEQLAACVTFSGFYDQITDIYRVMAEWMESNGYTFSGKPMFLHYIKSPHEVKDNSELVSELCIPVRKI